jgi:hypothetical protein
VSFEPAVKTHPEGLADQFGHAAAAHANLASNRGDRFAGMKTPQNLGSLHLTPWRRLRTTQAFELLYFLSCQHQPSITLLSSVGPRCMNVSETGSISVI